jgi:hypothetical protein
MKLRIVFIPLLFILVWGLVVSVISQAENHHNVKKQTTTKTIIKGSRYNRLTKQKVN